MSNVGRLHSSNRNVHEDYRSECCSALIQGGQCTGCGEQAQSIKDVEADKHRAINHDFENFDARLRDIDF